MIVSGGRPLYAILTLFFYFVHNVRDFVYFRAISIIGIISLSIYIYRAILKDSDLPGVLRLTVAILVGLIPSFQVYSVWAVTAFYPWAALLAVFGFRVFNKEELYNFKNFIISTFIITASMMVYQPAAMMFWFAAAASWIPTTRVFNTKKAIESGFIMSTALLIDFISSKTLPYFVFHSSYELPRASITHNIESKLTWFISQPIIDALNLVSILGSFIVSIVILLIIAPGIILYIFRSNDKKIIKLFFCFLLVFLSYLPNLLVKGDWASYRTQIALTSIFTLYLIIALNYYFSFINSKKQMVVSSIIIIATAIFVSRGNIINEFLIPQKNELSIIKSYISNFKFMYGNKICIIPSSWKDSLAPFVRYDEFGEPSSANTWTPKPMIWFIMHDNNMPEAQYINNARVVNNINNNNECNIVLDLKLALAENKNGTTKNSSPR